MKGTTTSIRKTCLFAFLTLLLCCCPVRAQQEKGDFEILFFSGGFFFNVDNTDFGDEVLTGSGSIARSSGNRGFNIGGKVGYFLTRNHEAGGGTSLSLFQSKFCIRSFEDGEVVGESCRKDTFFAMSLIGFYRYNFAGDDRKGFPFVGAELAAADLTRNFTGNIRVRPHAGYKYFLKENVALDFSVGYSAELNKKRDNVFFREREGTIDGQFALSIVF